MNDANHIGNLTDMVVGDNDHGDAIPEPKCGSCGVPWIDHMGIMGTCADNAALREDLRDSLEAHDEMRLEIVRLTKERDEARRMYCQVDCTAGEALLFAQEQGWDCFKQEPLPLKRKTEKEYDPRVISLEELERTTRNLRMND